MKVLNTPIEFDIIVVGLASAASLEASSMTTFIRFFLSKNRCKVCYTIWQHKKVDINDSDKRRKSMNCRAESVKRNIFYVFERLIFILPNQSDMQCWLTTSSKKRIKKGLVECTVVEIAQLSDILNGLSIWIWITEFVSKYPKSIETFDFFAHINAIYHFFPVTKSTWKI